MGWYQAITATGTPTTELLGQLTDEGFKFEKELKRRGTLFFGGDKPGMLDYL